jgi:LCP family protein required for cell wall assembly
LPLRVSGVTWLGLLCLLVFGLLAGSVALLRATPPAPAPELEFVLPEPAPAEVLAEEVTRPSEEPRDEPAASPTPTSVPAIAVAQPTPVVTWNGPRSVNYVLLGLDRRDNELARPDVIIIGNVDLREKRASLLSVPRDLLVTIPGYGRDRINTAFVYGELDRKSGGGAALLGRAVEQNFGVHIDHYAVLDFNCFRSIVDAIGGLSVNVPQRIVDPYYPTEDYRRRTVVFEPGLQQMDGNRALEYVRTRYTTSDFGRMHRQQQIVAATRERLLSLNALPSVPRIVADCGGVTTDLGILEVIGLANAARDIRGEDTVMQVIESPLVADVITPAGAMVLQPRWELIRPLVQRVFPTSTTVAGEGRLATP